MGWGKKKIIKAATWNARRKKGECACGCGKPAKGDFYRPKCAKNVVKEGSKEYKSIMDIDNSLYDSKGRNKKGIRYDDSGKRIWD